MRSSTSTIARKSLSRKLLLRLLVRQPQLSRRVLSQHLSVQESVFSQYESGEILMPLAVQERLATFVLVHEPGLHRAARQLVLQVNAARRYEAGEVVGHMTSLPSWR